MKQPKSHWNYRIMAFEHLNGIHFRVCEVHYKKGVPVAYAESGAVMCGDDIAELRSSANRMFETILKLEHEGDRHKIIYAGDKFPQYYEPK